MHTSRFLVISISYAVGMPSHPGSNSMNHRLFVLACAVLHCSRFHLPLPPASPPLGVTKPYKISAILIICVCLLLAFNVDEMGFSVNLVSS